MNSLTLVIPAYNEENGIAEIVNRILAVRPDLDNAGIHFEELLVVDDGSKDKTAVITQGIADKETQVKLISHVTNKGYGAALKTGFHQAKGDLIGFLDADGTYPPEFFPQLCLEALNGADLVIGSRMGDETSQMPVTRRIGNLFFATLLSIIGRQRVTDSASGMRVFKRTILERMMPLPDGLNLTPVMSTRAIHENIPMSEISIPYSERIGASKLSVVHDGSLFLRSMVWTAMTYNPVRILGLIGIAGISLALIAFLGLLIARLQGRTVLASWEAASLFAGSVSGVLGVSLFSLGVTFNYLVSLFHQRPIRQGLFGKPIFKQPLDRHFWWMGLATTLVGLIIGISALILGFRGWEMSRLWLYYLGSAMLTLVGAQLIIYWILLRVLDELSQRNGIIRSKIEQG